MGIPATTGLAASGLPPKGDQANAVVAGTIIAVGVTQPFAFRGPMNMVAYGSINTTLTTTAGSLAATVGSASGLAIGNAISSKNLPAGSTIGNLVSTTATLQLSPHTHYGFFDDYGNVTGNFPTDRIVGATITVPQPAVEGLTLPANTTVLSVTQANVGGSSGGPGQGPVTPGIIKLSATPTAVPVSPLPVPFNVSYTANAVLVTGADTAAIFTGAAISYSATLQLERSFDGGSTWIVCNIGGGGALAQWTAGTPLSITFGEPEKNVLYRLNCIAYTSGTINYRFSQTGGAAESLAIGPLTSG
jgi:hypothetical protein